MLLCFTYYAIFLHFPIINKKFTILLFIFTFSKIDVVFVFILFDIFIIFILISVLNSLFIFIGFAVIVVRFNGWFLYGQVISVIFFSFRSFIEVFCLRCFVIPSCFVIMLRLFHAELCSMLLNFSFCFHIIVITFSFFMQFIAFIANISSIF